MNDKLTTQSETHQWLIQVKEIIMERMDDPNLTIPQIAREIFMSERQFYRRIKSATGETPNRYLRQFRLKKAKEILENNAPVSIKEVALSVGYSRSDYFSRLYESAYGQRPEYHLYNNN